MIDVVLRDDSNVGRGERGTMFAPVYIEKTPQTLSSSLRNPGGSPPIVGKTKSEYHGDTIQRVACLVDAEDDDAKDNDDQQQWQQQLPATRPKSRQRQVELMGDLSCCDNDNRYKKSFWRVRMQYEPGCDARKDVMGGGIMNTAGHGPDWHSQHYPTCNEMHMFPFESFYGDLLGVGSLAAVYMIYDEKQRKQHNVAVLKTYRHDLIGSDEMAKQCGEKCDMPRLLEKTRIDAMAMERLTKSPNVINVYGHCGQSLLIEVGGMTLIDAYTIKKKGNSNNTDEKGDVVSPLQKLKWGMQAARALSEVHSIDSPNGMHPTLAHGDVSRSNFLVSHLPSNIEKEEVVIMNDFNQGYLLRYKDDNNDGNTMCGIINGGNHGMPETSRPPERYQGFNQYSRNYDKVDIFGLGVVLAEMLLEIEHPFLDIPEKELQDKPRILEVPLDVYKSNDVSVNALLYAALACMSYEPNNRPTAHKIAEGLRIALEWIEPHNDGGNMMTDVGKEEIKQLFLENDQHFASLKLQKAKEDSVV